ncbi:hypothetical protein Hanom_Chr04g00362071 [Helianthus anomalus]
MIFGLTRASHNCFIILKVTSYAVNAIKNRISVILVSCKIYTCPACGMRI